MRYSGLAKRLDRLEARDRPRRLPRMAFIIHEEDAPSDHVVAFKAFNGPEVPRLPGEALSALLARAWATPGTGSAMFAVYAHKSKLEQPEEVPAEPTQPLMPDDPYALAGIGRRATKAELNRMGVRSRNEV